MSDDMPPKHWPYRADIPRRYAEHAAAYRARGGKVRLEQDAAAFVGDGDHGDVARFYFLCMMQDQIQKERLEGDLAEVGVRKGATASVLARIARRKGARLWLFDTFEGAAAEDRAGADAAEAGASLDEVRARVGEEQVAYIQGRFPEAADDAPADLRFCVAHVDCSLYEQAGAALAYLYPRMVPGGFLVIHGYASLARTGVERAADEFFADKPESVAPLADRAGSCVIRRARDPATDPHWSRRPLPIGEWIEAGDDGIGGALGKGWSGPEPWGVWGVGEQHALTLPPSPKAIRLEVDCAVPMLGDTEWQAVTIAADGAAVDVWQFTRKENRGIRAVTIPAGKKGKGALVTFHPSDPVLRPCDHDPDSTDDRELGLSVHRIRLNG